MASFYSSLSGEGDMLPSYTSSELADHKLYLNQASNSLLYQNLLSDAQELVEHETGVRGDTEMVFIPPSPNNGPTGVEQMGMQLNMDPHYSDRGTVAADSNCSEPISQYHGLSLSLGSQEPSLVHFHSDFNHYSNMGLGSFITQNMQSQDSNVENVQYLSFDSTEKTFNIANLGSSKETSFVFSSDQGADIFGNSKYLKAARDLLDEIVSVHNDCKWSEKAKNLDHLAPHGSSRMNVMSKDEISAEPLMSKNGVNDLSPSERHDLQNKLTKLSSMLGEVDNRYRHYCHEMQVVASSFDSFSGRGAAFPYTSLALKTISQQFRLLRDAIKKQIQATQKALGEQDDNLNGPGVLSRLRFVDQQLRKQMAIQQFGITRQPWRPQRGLPETAVSVLRAWLFEHFLHPYPKDSEKIALARQTGLSRSQVANWFINARVRLWKPMIEEIYNEELGDDGTRPKSSPENTTTNQEMQSFYEMNETPSNYTVNVTQKLAPEDNNASSKMINDTNTSHFFLALGLQHNENDSSHAMAGVSRARDASSSSSPVVERLDYYYDDQNRFDNSHLMSDFVT